MVNVSHNWAKAGPRTPDSWNWKEDATASLFPASL